MVRTALGGLPRARLAALGVGAAAVATWYLWPVVSGNHGDVAVYGGGTIESSVDLLSFQLRDRGRGVQWFAAGSTWCELAELDIAVDDVDLVVLAPESLGTCDGQPAATTVSRLSREVDVIAIAIGGAGAATASTATNGATVVDSTVLLGTSDVASMPCEWWDNCAGTVEIRDATGELTPAGHERLARMISAAIG